MTERSGTERPSPWLDLDRLLEDTRAMEAELRFLKARVRSAAPSATDRMKFMDLRVSVTDLYGLRAHHRGKVHARRRFGGHMLGERFYYEVTLEDQGKLLGDLGLLEQYRMLPEPTMVESRLATVDPHFYPSSGCVGEGWS